MNEKSRSNRILGYSFVASLVINFGWIAWVGYSGIFGHAGSSADLHPTQIRLYTPITVKPRPKVPTVKPIRVAVPPPRPLPHRVARVQPPRSMPRPTPPAPRTALLPKPAAISPQRKPPPERRMAMLPKPTLPSKPQAAFYPRVPAQAPRPAPPTPAEPKGPVMTDTARTSGGSASPETHRPSNGLLPSGMDNHSAPGLRGSGENTPILPPSIVPDDSGARENPHPKIPTPIESHEAPPKPPNYDNTTEQRSEAEAIGGFPAPETSDLDTSTISGECILMIDVSEEGRASRVRVKHSSGNRDFDSRCVEIAKRVHYRPAVQNHLRFPSHFEQTWSPSS